VNNRPVAGPGYLRRHESALLLVGAIEPEVQPWLRAAGYEYRAVRTAKAALKALAENPAQLILVEGESSLEALRDDARLGEAWLLAVTDREDSKTAVAALQAGADDYLPRPFSRTELLARTRAGVRAAQQRSDDTLLRALMMNVPGAIYRSAWHAGHTLALISDEIERISGYPPENFIASAKRTLMSIVHPDDHERVMAEVARAGEEDGAFVVEYRIKRADGDVRWVLDRGQRVPGPGGRVCQLGFLGGLEPVAGFDPIADLPTGVQLSFYGSAFVLGTEGFPLADIPLQEMIGKAEAGRYQAKPVRVFGFEEIVEAHRTMERGLAGGKMVVAVN